MRLLEPVHSRRQHASTFPNFLLLTLFYLSFLTDHSHASNADSVAQEDHNHYRISDLRSNIYGTLHNDHKIEVGNYKAEFLGADRGIIGRADDAATLKNNIPGEGQIEYEDTQSWTFPKIELSLSPSQASSLRTSLVEPDVENSHTFDNLEDGPIQPRQAAKKMLYITFSMCDHPGPEHAYPKGAPPPLQLYVSTDPENSKPDQKKHDHAVSVEHGYGALNITVSGDVYFAVTAPSKSREFDGSYSYQLTCSTDEPFTTYVDKLSMVLVDSDTSAALLSTKDDTNTTRYSVFVHPQTDPGIWGLEGSLCALKRRARYIGNLGNESRGDVETVKMKSGALASKQQFYVKNLTGSSAYYAIMADANGERNGVPGGGGKVWKTLGITTNVTGNCAVIYNLTFCTDVAYAVPANPDNLTDLAALKLRYDNNARDKYQNFNKSLQQVPCDTTSSAQYSLARNCNDCDNAYRTWLCAVTIPRCADFTSKADYLMPRAVWTAHSNGSTPSGLDQAPYINDNKSALFMESSRNSMIDEEIRPGPYKEVLPCIDLCYDIVRSCPAILKFACPLKEHGLEYAYGYNGTEVTCNYPGAAFHQNLAGVLRWNVWFLSAALLSILSNFVQMTD